MAQGASHFVIRRGTRPDRWSDVLTEPAAHAYEWAPFGSTPKPFRSEADATRFGRAMLAGPFHVSPA